MTAFYWILKISRAYPEPSRFTRCSIRANGAIFKVKNTHTVPHKGKGSFFVHEGISIFVKLSPKVGANPKVFKCLRSFQNHFYVNGEVWNLASFKSSVLDGVIHCCVTYQHVVGKGALAKINNLRLPNSVLCFLQSGKHCSLSDVSSCN